MNSGGCPQQLLERIYSTLKKRGVDCHAKDIYQRTALHYAVISKSVLLVDLILKSETDYKVNEVDSEGHTPLSLFLHGDQSMSYFYNRA